MGNNQPPPPPPPQPRDQNDVILDLRMTKRRLENDSKKALKEQEKNMQKAKDALNKNNEEGAKMFLQSAAQKKQESLNLIKMAQKIDYIESQVKNTQINSQMMNQLQKITPVMTQYAQNMSVEQLYSNMTQFESTLDEITVQGKVMDQMWNKDSDVQSNMQVDQALQQMKQELIAQTDMQMAPQQMRIIESFYLIDQFQQIQQPQQQQQQNLNQQGQYYQQGPNQQQGFNQ